MDVRAVDVPTDSTAGGELRGQGCTRHLPDRRRRGDRHTRRRHVHGVEMGEQLHAATIAIVSGIPIARLWDAVPAFPSRTEIWLRLLEAYEGW